ncbi:MAG: hypothetical protein ACOCP8_07555, partial [archaeon]
MCSIFGTSNKKLLKHLGIAGMVRGKDATGVALNNDLKVVKGALKADEFLWDDLDNADFYMGHTRAKTQGSENFNYNNHPFYGENNKYVLAHNGIISNDRILSLDFDLPNTEIMTDSYIIVQLIDFFKKKSFKSEIDIEIIKEAIEYITGSFALSIMTKNKLFLLRKTNPLNIIYNKKELIYASTKNMLNKALKKIGKNEYDYGIAVEIQEEVIYEYNLQKKSFIQ